MGLTFTSKLGCGSYISLLLKLPLRQLEPWFIVWSFFHLRLPCISKNLLYGHTWNTAVTSGLVPLVATWNCHISYKIKYAGLSVLHLLPLEWSFKIDLPIVGNLNTVLHALHLALAVSPLPSLTTFQPLSRKETLPTVNFFFWHTWNELLFIFINFFIRTEKSLNWNIHDATSINDGNNKELHSHKHATWTDLKMLKC